MTDAGSNHTTYVYNGNGQLTETIDPNGHTTKFGYDGLGRQITVTDGENRVTTTYYDSRGNVTGVAAPDTGLTQYSVDALGRVTQTTDADSNVTTKLYDNNGNVTSMTDASGNTTTFAYDGNNQKISETRADASGHPLTFLYDANGNLTESIDQMGRAMVNSYDTLNRLTTQVWKDSGGTATQTLTYSYDGNGDLLTATSSTTGTYTMSYDALGRVTVAQDVWGNTLTMTYDENGNRTKVQDSQGGTTTSVYNSSNQLTQRQFGGSGQTPLRVDFTYKAGGELSGITRYSDLAGTTTVASTSYTYDAADAVTNIQHKASGGTNIGNYTYTYNSTTGRLDSEQHNGLAATNYGYDAAGQLTNAGLVTIGFDGTGNRSYSYNGTTTQTYGTTTGNQMQSDGVWSYSYDAAGEMTKKTKGLSAETWTYGYDNRGQMTYAKQYTKDPGNGGVLEMEADYEYDVFGNRIQTQVDSNGDGIIDTTTRYAYDGWKPTGAGSMGNANWDIWADLDNTNTVTTRYLRGDVIDQLFAFTDAFGVAHWTLGARQNTVHEVINSGGSTLDYISYDGWGLPSETVPGAGGRYMWTGREYDTETGLQYNRARYYDPANGRWTTQDPMGFQAGDSNLYRYVQSNPTLAFDPSGLIPWDADWDRIKITVPIAGQQVFMDFIPAGWAFGPSSTNVKFLPQSMTSTQEYYLYGPRGKEKNNQKTIGDNTYYLYSQDFYTWQHTISVARTNNTVNANGVKTLIEAAGIFTKGRLVFRAGKFFLTKEIRDKFLKEVEQEKVTGNEHFTPIRPAYQVFYWSKNGEPSKGFPEGEVQGYVEFFGDLTNKKHEFKNIGQLKGILADKSFTFLGFGLTQ